MERWGKCTNEETVTLRCRISELKGNASQYSRHFQAHKRLESISTFGEALEFYSVPQYNLFLMIYHLLVDRFGVLGRWSGKWSEDMRVMEISKLINLIGIWEYKGRVHSLRRHPGLDMMIREACGHEEMKDE